MTILPDRPTRDAIQTVSAAVKYAFHRRTHEHLTMEDVIAAEKVQRWLDETVEVFTPAADWSQAPAWANWWAVDPDGYYHWFDNEPILTEVTGHRELIGPHWSHFGSKQHLYDAINIPIGVDWRTLKQQRPQEPA